MVHRVLHDGAVSHVTGIVTITADEAMPKQFDGEWLRGNFPNVAQSMDQFIDKIKLETQGELIGDLEESSGYPSTSTRRVMQPTASGPRRSRRVTTRS